MIETYVDSVFGWVPGNIEERKNKMPCVYDETPGEIEARICKDMKTAAEIEAEKRKIEAMLCAVTRRLEHYQGKILDGSFDYFLNTVDWAEAGVTKGDFLDWQHKHRRADAERKEREAQQLEEKKRNALSKLSLEEKKLLGLA